MTGNCFWHIRPVWAAVLTAIAVHIAVIFAVLGCLGGGLGGYSRSFCRSNSTWFKIQVKNQALPEILPGL
jgi:hypothetical protein